MSLLRFARLSDAPPPAREMLDVADDGSLTGWRSQGPVVGACAGRAPDLAALRALVERVAGTEAPRHGDVPADATVESLEAGGQELETTEHGTIGGAWGELLAAARVLLDDVLPAGPVAAVALEIRVTEGAPGGLALAHRGDRPLVLELGAGWAEITRWRDGAPVGSEEVHGLGARRVEAGPGWSLEVPVRIPGGEPGDLLTASCRFVAVDAGVMVPAVLTGRATAS